MLHIYFTIDIFNFTDTLYVLTTIDRNRDINIQELLTNRSIYLWPVEYVDKVVFECISTEGNPQIYLSSNQSRSITSLIEFNEFPTSLNGFLFCYSNVTGMERRIYIASEYKMQLHGQMI